jgi:AraC family transcriptional regulator of adaptative response / DNA-3-methyladenine glycosylase II
MKLDSKICYRAVSSRDPRFDGRFFTAVKSTGIYCRPVCPARTPKRSNCLFFPCAAAAEEAGYRPCLRCCPEAAPGTPAWMGTSASVSRALRLIARGALNGEGVNDLAMRLGMGDRHLRRLFIQHLGAPPKAVAATFRVQLAKKLIDETDLSITEIAFSSGFNSIRRFNDAIRETYGCAPSALRKSARSGSSKKANGYVTLRLSYRPPFSWQRLIDFLAPRAIPGVEWIEGGTYRRTMELDEVRGVIEVKPGRGSFLSLRVPVEASRKLACITERVRSLFDLHAAPEEIRRHLARDPLLARRVKARPGLRVPGAWNGFELAVRAILGQQVTVRGASTLAGRLVSVFGAPLDTEYGKALNRNFPKPEVLARANLQKIGIPRTRADAIRSLAKLCASGGLAFDGSRSIEETMTSLTGIKGLGPWTAQYIAMRALEDPDAFPAGDLGLRRALAETKTPLTAARLAEKAEAWRPWRAYAAMHIWMNPDSISGRR